MLRFHSSCPWRDEDAGKIIEVPALIAAFRSIDNNAITAVQRVRLAADGAKLGRRMLGVVHRAAVMLAAPDNGTLAIGEGVETAMAAMQLGFNPAWAVGSCGAIGHFPVIDGVEKITLLGERDAASATAVKICGERWTGAGRGVRVALPEDGCNDLNDELMKAAPW